MDPVLQRAHEKRQQLLSGLARVDAFLAEYHEIQQEIGRAPVTRDAASAQPKAPPPPPVNRKRGGVGADTLEAAVAIIRERGEPMSTRELLPLILARGIPVGGNDPVATLSARISNKGVLQLSRGKWLVGADEFENLDASASGNEEAADQHPAKEQSAASVSASQGGTDGPALTN